MNNSYKGHEEFDRYLLTSNYLEDTYKYWNQVNQYDSGTTWFVIAHRLHASCAVYATDYAYVTRWWRHWFVVTPVSERRPSGWPDGMAESDSLIIRQNSMELWQCKCTMYNHYQHRTVDKLLLLYIVYGCVIYIVVKHTVISCVLISILILCHICQYLSFGIVLYRSSWPWLWPKTV